MKDKELYEKWWSAMNAPNSGALIKAFGKDIDEIWKEVKSEKSMECVCSHPLVIIFADKLLQLAVVCDKKYGQDRDKVISGAYDQLIEYLQGDK